MKPSDASQSPAAAELISRRITEIGDWRGESVEESEVLRDFDPPEQLPLFVPPVIASCIGLCFAFGEVARARINH